jgi:hypothetical protein
MTPYYCVLLFGCVAIWLLTRHPGFSLAGVIGLGAATLAFLSLAGGALVFLVCALVVIAKRLLGAEKGWQPWAFAALLLAMFVISGLFVPFHTSNDAIKAHDLSQFFYAEWTLVSWPFNFHWIVPIFFVNAPAVIFSWRTLRQPPPGNATAWALMGVSLWITLFYLGLAYGRGAAINATRYFDFCSLSLMINYICAGSLIATPRSRALVVGWAAAIAIGGVLQTMEYAPQELRQHHAMALQQEANVKSFLATGTFLPGATYGANWMDRSLPYRDPARLAGLLSDDRVRRFLPDNLRVAIPADRSSEAAPPRREHLAGLRDAILGMGPLLSGLGLVLLVAVVIALASG